MDPLERMIDTVLLREARCLASEDGENHEYDRALAELIVCMTPGLNFDDTEAVRGLLTKKD